jgi:hypothetical protein
VYLPVKYIPTPPTLDQPDAPWLQWISFFKESPTAGQAAENQYYQLMHGKDDENEPEPTEQPTQQSTNQQPTETAGHTLRGLTRVKSPVPPRPRKPTNIK